MRPSFRGYGCFLFFLPAEIFKWIFRSNLLLCGNRGKKKLSLDIYSKCVFCELSFSNKTAPGHSTAMGIDDMYTPLPFVPTCTFSIIHIAPHYSLAPSGKSQPEGRSIIYVTSKVSQVPGKNRAPANATALSLADRESMLTSKR